MQLGNELCEHIRICVDILFIHARSVDFHSSLENCFCVLCVDRLLFAFDSLLFDCDFDFISSMFLFASVDHLHGGHQLLGIQYLGRLLAIRWLIVIHKGLLKLIAARARCLLLLQ